jgi:hypothetical protein
MTAPPPLTHHEILELVEPFARKGRHVDLAATDRLARKLLFKPVDHADVAPDLPALRETLALESLGTGSFRLSRVVSGTIGGRSASATLEARGTDPGELLARFDAVGLARHFCCGPGYTIARTYAFEAFSGGTDDLPVMTRGVVQVDGLMLTFDILTVRGSAADLTLEPFPGEKPALPEDLLAVVGWDWARLVPQTSGWTSRMRLRGSGPPRTLKAEQALEKAARHLAGVLAEPPHRFHERFFWARWGSVLRRLIPNLTAVGIIGGVLALPRLAPTVDPGFWLMLHYVPVGIIGLAFMLQELPRFEIPPLPSRLNQPSWRAALSDPLQQSAWPATR